MSNESYVLDLAKVRKDELSSLEKSNIVLAAFCFIFLLSGLPAWLIMQLWVHLHVSSILHVVSSPMDNFLRADSFLFKLLYIWCLGSTVPLLILIASSLLGRQFGRIGSQFIISAEGIAWKPKDFLSAMLLRTLGLPHNLVPWEKIALVSGMESIVDMKKCLQREGELVCLPSISSGGLRFQSYYGRKWIRCIGSLNLSVMDTETKRDVLAAIRKFAPNTKMTDHITKILLDTTEVEGRDLQYTEVWLKLLDSSKDERKRHDELSAGEILKDGRFRIESKIATGGQANLYLASDLESENRKVVLKEYIVSSVNDTSVMHGLEEFETESGIMRRIDSPNICKLIDIFVDDQRAYLAIEYIEGLSLRTLVEKQGAMTEVTALQIIKQLCSAVAHLHSLPSPVIHRDISPDNILLNNYSNELSADFLQEGNEVKLVDFSVAIVNESKRIGQVVGKPSYMSVDQFRGFAKKTNDLYAIGATLYFLLVGEDPSPVSASRPSSKRPEISNAVDDFVFHCTGLSEPERFNSIDEVVVAIEDLQCKGLELTDSQPELLLI